LEHEVLEETKLIVENLKMSLFTHLEAAATYNSLVSIMEP